ncbi:MAG: hypothetical protein KatS3mg061_0544 [Dehalococcoidia bacterium]|nr:MAG: hypothetical protein KatS3mg061_0544 [Dehalococcoidia bacterium]
MAVHQLNAQEVRRITGQLPRMAPSPSRWHRWIERAALVVGVIAPLSTIPQIVQIYTTQSAEDINIGTWTLFIGFGLFWLLYGITTRALPIILTNLAWLICYSIVLVGAVIYR